MSKLRLDPYVMHSQNREALYEAQQAKAEPIPNFKRVELRNTQDHLVLTLEPQYDWLRLPLINWLIEADLMQRVNACEFVKKPKYIIDFSNVFDD